MRASASAITRSARRHADLLLALVLLAEIQMECWLGSGIPDAHRPVTGLVAVLFVAPVAFRSRRPGEALAAVSGVAVFQQFLGLDLMTINGVLLPPIVISYSVGARLELAPSLRWLSLGLVLFGAAALKAPPGVSSVGKALQDALFVAMVLAAPWFVGRLAREREGRTEAFRDLAGRADAERVERERAAIAEERLRIGGELQDIIAHSVSAMVIQAGGARRLLAGDPDQARESILTVERTGRETLGDLRRLLGMLRRDDDPRALAPQPGLDQLADLVSSLAAEGFACGLEVEGEQPGLTPGVNLVGYRVAEAALSSAARNGSTTASVIVRYRPRELALEVRGDGAMPSDDEELEAMAARVALYDGRLSARPGDRFEVGATLPLAEAVA